MSKLARREYKFFIDEAIAAKIRRMIEGYCEGDKHAAKTGGRYLCDTLYFDSLRLDLYRATIDNSPDRHKLRIRTYPLSGSNPVFLEIKRRVDETIIKTRSCVWGDWAKVIEDGNLDSVAASERLGAQNFLTYYRASGTGLVVPTVLVRYEREPYTSRVDYYARVTFDREVRFQRHPELSVTPEDNQWTAIDDQSSMWPLQGGSPVLLELKFLSEAPPRWMRLVVQNLELRRLAYCKYTRAVDALLRPPIADDMRVST